MLTSGLHDVDGDERIAPAKAMVLGPVRVIPLEYPGVTCRAIDLAAPEWTRPSERHVTQLVADITAADGEAVTAWRRGHRWVPTPEAVRLDAVADPQDARLRHQGVYLITGGYGGVGLTLAEHLARTVQARLVLIGRAGLPDRADWPSYLASAGDDDRRARQIRAVQALERAGADVLPLTADVAREADVRRAIDAARARWGRIDGVIHAAGVAGGGVIQLKTREAAERVFAPKVAGTEVLAAALEGMPLDFFALCSSMTSLVGGGGQVDYCAANAYLDAFAHAHARQAGVFTVSIDWDAWKDVGMAVETGVPGELASGRAAMLARGIAPAEGAEAFLRILSRVDAPQVAVSTTPLGVLPGDDEEPAGGEETGEPGPAAAQGHERPALETEDAGPRERDRGTGRGHLGAAARDRASRPPRRLLRARGALAARHAAGGPGADGVPDRAAARGAVRRAHDRRPVGGGAGAAAPGRGGCTAAGRTRGGGVERITPGVRPPVPVGRRRPALGWSRHGDNGRLNRGFLSPAPPGTGHEHPLSRRIRTLFGGFPLGGGRVAILL